MFDRRNRSSLSDTLRQATDPELRSLGAEISERQETIAELELDLFDLRVALAEFERRLEIRIRPLERQLQDLRTQLQESRHWAARRAQWGDEADLNETPDVVKQFERAWTPRGAPSKAGRAPAPSQADQARLKQIYRALAKRFHPDLTTDPGQKVWREEMMAKVNQAYQSNDLNALMALEQQPDRPAQRAQKSREQILAEMAAEVLRLDGLISKLKRQLDELASSNLAQLQLNVSMARQSGGDLLGEIARDLELEIAQVKAQLAALS